MNPENYDWLGGLGGPEKFFELLLERPMHFVLDAEHNVIPLERDRSGRHADTLMWAMSFENFRERQVARTTIWRWWGAVWVSTVFLGLDHSFGMQGPPIVFETMAFPVWGSSCGQEWDPATDEHGTSDRYATWAEAVAGHWDIVNHVRAHRGTLREAWAFWSTPVRVSFARFKKDMGLPMLPIVDNH